MNFIPRSVILKWKVKKRKFFIANFKIEFDGLKRKKRSKFLQGRQ